MIKNSLGSQSKHAHICTEGCLYFHTFLSESLSHNEVMRSLRNDFKKDCHPHTVSTVSDQKTWNKDIW